MHAWRRVGELVSDGITFSYSTCRGHKQVGSAVRQEGGGPYLCGSVALAISSSVFLDLFCADSVTVFPTVPQLGGGTSDDDSVQAATVAFLGSAKVVPDFVALPQPQPKLGKVTAGHATTPPQPDDVRAQNFSQKLYE